MTEDPNDPYRYGRPDPLPPYGTAPQGGQNPYGQNPYGQNPYGPPQYGQNPYGPPQYGMPPGPWGAPDWNAPAVARPASIEWSFRLMLLLALLQIANVVYTVSDRNEIRAAVERRTVTTPSVDIDSIYSALIVFTVGFSVIYLVLFALLAWQVRRGKQWARVITWVLAGLGIIGLLGTLSSSSLGVATGVSRTVTIISGVIYLVVAILLAQRSSNEYVNSQRRQPFRR